MSAPRDGHAAWPDALRGITGATSLALCLAGAISLGEGAAVPVQAELAQRRLERTFERRLETEGMAPAMASGTAPPALARTDKRTAAENPPAPSADGPVARISVQRLGISEIVLAGNGSHEQLADGPTMIRRSDDASPVTVIAAHRDTHFLFIRDLREGDEVTMQFANGLEERYRISRFETVRWDRFTYPLDPVHPLLALATCYPFGGTEYGGPWRRIAWAERVEPAEVRSPIHPEP